MGQDVQIHVKAGSAYPVNVSTCGSVWVCPVCSAKIRARRSVEVERAVELHQAAGGDVSMLTLTVRHKRWMSLKAVRDSVRESWRRLQQGQEWRDLRAFLVGTVRAFEVTVGPNGWHVHLHVLLLPESGVDRGDLDEMVALLFDEWAALNEARLGMSPDRVHGINHLWMRDGAGEYVAKLQEAGLEVAYADGKRGRYPFGLLEGVACGDLNSIQLWREYADAMKGARALEWSRGLRARLGMDAEKSDEELAKEDVDGEAVDVVSVDDWRRMLYSRHESGELLVVWYLGQVETAWRVAHPPG